MKRKKDKNQELVKTCGPNNPTKTGELTTVNVLTFWGT